LFEYNKIRGISKTCSKSTYVYKGECGWEHFVFNEVTRSDFIFNDGLGFMNDQYVLAAGSMETYSVINVGSTNSLKVDFENPSSGYKLAGMICIDAHGNELLLYFKNIIFYIIVLFPLYFCMFVCVFWQNTIEHFLSTTKLLKIQIRASKRYHIKIIFFYDPPLKRKQTKNIPLQQNEL
jgi:hypothetical protein